MRPSDILVTDQVAVVTGGGAGLGQGIAVTLAAFGADVVVADKDLERAAVTVAKVEAEGRAAVAVAYDALEPESVGPAVDAAVERFGRLDILVNNVGGVRPGRFVDQDARSWQRHVDLNLLSCVHACHAAAPVLVDGGRGGSIVNVASIEALRAAPLFAVYAACKAAMCNFTRSLAVELAEHRVRVNAIAPDVLATPGLRGIVRGPVPEPLPPMPAGYDDALAAYVPLGGEGSPEDAGAAAVFLCSPMARYVTGVTLNVDGGTWASSGWTRAGEGWHLFPRPYDG